MTATDDRFAMLTFDRRVAAPPAALWQAWTAPAARAIWAAPHPSVTVDFVESDSRPGGREVSICRVAGQPDIRCEVTWLILDPAGYSVNAEFVSSGGVPLSAALVTADAVADGDGSRLRVTVQLSAQRRDMAAGYRQGFDAGLTNLAGVASRLMVIERRIRAPRQAVWAAWTDPARLPGWWGPDGFTCRTSRIDLRPGGDWVFDMIGPDGTVWPNHHRYTAMQAPDRLAYTLHWGENGPRHADAWAAFAEDGDGATRVTLGMVFDTDAALRDARAFGAESLGQQTLGKLARAAGEAA